MLQRDWRVPERLKRELAGLYSRTSLFSTVGYVNRNARSVGSLLLGSETFELTFVFLLFAAHWRGRTAIPKEQRAAPITDRNSPTGAFAPLS